MIEPAVFDAFDRHERIAIQFSGGADSTAMLWLLRPLWARATVYWLNTGDNLPEAAAWVSLVRQVVPNFVEVASPREQVIAMHGMPADAVPSVSTPGGRMVGGPVPALQDRLDCCYRSLMLPLHERMIRDRVSLLVRGQKDSDEMKSPIRSGEVIDGFEVLYPLESWSHDDVMAFLRANELPILPVYHHGKNLPDCVTCPAWTDDRRAALLAERHPDLARKYRNNLMTVRAGIAAALANMDAELEQLLGVN